MLSGVRIVSTHLRDSIAVAVLAAVLALLTTRAWSAPQTTPAETVLPPGATITLVKPPAAGEGSVTLTNQSAVEATVTLDGILRIFVLSGQVVDVIASSGVQRIRCPDDPRSADACFSVVGAARIVFTFIVPAPAPIPAPIPPIVPLGQSATILPGDVAVFTRPSLRVQEAMIGVEVINLSDLPATGVAEGDDVTLTLPEGVAARAEVVYEGVEQRIDPCTVHPRTPNVVRCRWFEFRATKASIRLTAAFAPPEMEALPLRSGCTNVVLTWPPYAPVSWVTESIHPAAAVQSVWTYVPGWGRFIGYAPGVPEAVNEYTVATAPLEAAFICLHETAVLNRPRRS